MVTNVRFFKSLIGFFSLNKAFIIIIMSVCGRGRGEVQEAFSIMTPL